MSNSIIKANAYYRSCMIGNLFLSMIKIKDAINYPIGTAVYRFGLNNFTTESKHVDIFTTHCQDPLSDCVKKYILYPLDTSIMNKK